MPIPTRSSLLVALVGCVLTALPLSAVPTAGLVWTEDLPQTEPLKANSVVRLSYDDGTGVTDIATLTGGVNGGWSGPEYAGGFILIPSSADTGTGTRVHHPRYAPILVTNVKAYDLDFSPGYLWQATGNDRIIQRNRPNGGFLTSGDGNDRSWVGAGGRNTKLFTNAVQVVGDTVYFSNTVFEPIGMYKTDAQLTTNVFTPVFTQSGAGAPAIYDFEVVGDQIYFADITNNAIRRVGIDGTGVTTLVSGAMFPNSIEVTDTAIYWTELNNRLIRRSNLDGTNPTTIRTTTNDPRGIAVVPLSLIDGPAPQAVAVAGVANTYSLAINTPVALTLSATSGLPVSLEIVSGPATVSGNSITYTGSGTVHLRASQAGNESFAPASMDYFINATPKLAQTINFDPLPNLIFSGSPITFTPTATASSGLTVNFSVVSGPATRNSTTGVVTVNGPGTVVIRASQVGNSTYAPAAPVERSFSVTEGAADSLTTFLTNAGVPSNLRGPNDDADNDGLNNLLEYALDLNPNGNGGGSFSGSVPSTTKTPSHLQFTYRRVRNDVTYIVVTSPNLVGGTWTSDGVTQGTPAGDGTTTASIPLGSGSGFLRLSVTKNPTP